MEGSTDAEQIAISLMEQQVYDLRMAFGRVAYDPNCGKLKEEYVKNLPDALKLVSDYLGENPFVAGQNMSYVDFWLYEYLLKVAVLVPEVFGEFDNLKKFVERIESLPRISAYLKERKPALFNGPMSKWNATC